MGEDQEFRHVCKFCRKSFQCGRSLGGHMRSHIINDTGGKLSTNHESTGYGLRENPKKTYRFTDHSAEDLEKFCEECGKSFQSRKALCGHMKCHSPARHKTYDPNSFEGSKRITRYCMMTTADSSLSLTNASSSVTEIEQDQEEVAMCLIMLSQDARNWGRFDFVAESFDAPSSNQASKNDSEIIKPEDLVDAAVKKEKIEKHVTNKTTPDKASYDSSKRKLSDHFDPDSSKRFTINTSDPKFFNISDKINRFECTSCNKTFHSYQALGGHRASHKRNKGFFASSIKSSTKAADRSSIEHFIEHCDKKAERGLRAKKSSEGHECSVCLKVFSSGQALGGHKRSHLVHQPPPPPETGIFIDLNFPAGPVEEHNNEEHAEYKPWWIGTINV